MLLKDFLRDDGGCKSSWSWRSISSKSKKPHIVLLRSWSKRAAATKMSAVHKLIKLLQFASSKSPSLLPKRSSEGNNDFVGDVSSEVKVKVKDILRWRSFRDLVDHDPTLPQSPHDRSTAAAATTTTSCSKRSSSWCDSDFTAEEELPPWGGENEEFWGKNAAATLKNIPKGDWSFEEYEQQSPVSVLASPFQQVEEFIVSPYHPTLANVQREKRNVRSEEQNLEREIGSNCNGTEEKAKKLLRHLKEDDNDDSDDVILDFLIEELGKFNDDDDDDCKILRIAKSWMDGELEEENRESFVKDMDKGICWNNKFKQEQQHLCHQLELTLFNDLIDHLVADLIYC
ncbi:hypothetical protein C2S52_011060 [Perilla frutescens var. hirtella]|nr:hypothetical protein C2S52_011060 [Perilla frutescens var. hirtella]KAH6817860.1 hypothetical protein C2S51_001463 [Perilla frutescens var. frutescens]